MKEGTVTDAGCKNICYRLVNFK